MELHYMLGLSDVFVLLFVTLGPPLKVPAAYFDVTRTLEPRAAKQLATRAFAFALAASLLGGAVGAALMAKWHISIPAMTLAAGVVFFLVSLRGVLAEYDAHMHPPVAPDPAAPVPSAFRIAVPMLVTPYGMAAIILLVARSRQMERGLTVGALVIAVMLLNLLAMRYARPILRFIGTIPLQLFTTIVGVLTIGLSLQILISGLVGLGLIDAGVVNGG